MALNASTIRVNTERDWITLEYNDGDTILQLKRAIETQHGHSIDDQELSFSTGLPGDPVEQVGNTRFTWEFANGRGVLQLRVNRSDPPPQQRGITVGVLKASESSAIHVGDIINNPPATRVIKDDYRCLKSLAFLYMESRSHDIDPAFTGTCEWLLRHNTYTRWAACDQGGLLWIRGKPGSGKSTLLKHALDNCEAGHDDNLVLSFFFHGRGNELQKTPLGFFRTLLYQILKKAPDSLPDLVDTFENKCKEIGEPDEKWQWSRKELQHFFESSLQRILEARSVWLFVDALDECGEENAVELFEWLKVLSRRLSPTTSQQLRICVSCRHYPILDRDCEFEICAENENKEDITSYVRDQLSHYPRLATSLVPALIFDHASGIFMWARLVVAQVKKLERESSGLKEIEAEIRSVPKELDKLYQELIRDMDKASIKLMQWICLATRPLTIYELPWAMAVEADSPFRSLRECQAAEGFMSGNEGKETQVEALSHGLAELTPASDTQTQVVQFIHQSVKDFFNETGLSALDSNSASADMAIGMAHYRLSRICIRYFAMEEIGQSTSYEEKDFPFLAYAATWIAHAKKCDARGVPQDDLLKLFAWPSSDNLVKQWVRIYRELVTRKSTYYFPSEEGTSLVHILSRYGIKGPLQAILQRVDTKKGAGWWTAIKLLFATGKADIDSRDSYSRTPLSWAAASGHKAVVKLLLTTGKGKVNVDSRDSRGRTPLSWAAANGHKAVVKLLLTTGKGKVNVDSRDSRGRTPLSWAAASGHKAVVELLLATGKADINSRNQADHTPLSWAAAGGYEAVVELLLATGKADIDLKDSYGQTPLSLAAASGHKAVIKLLLTTGKGKVNVNSRDSRGRTPLSWAAAGGYEAVVELLLSTGQADIDLSDVAGRTPLLWAAENGHGAVIKLLRSTGQVKDPTPMPPSQAVAKFPVALGEGSRTTSTRAPFHR